MATTFTQFKKDALKKPTVKAEYDSLQAEYAVIRTIIKERLKRGWSQSDLAEAVGTRQPVISRLERGEGNPSLATLGKIAKVFDKRLEVTLR